MKYFYILIVLMSPFPQVVIGQRIAKPKTNTPKYPVHRTGDPRFSVKLKAGLTQFFGELNEQDMLGAIGLEMSGRINRAVSLDICYSAGKVGGQSSSFLNSYFVNEYNTAEILGRWNLTRQFSRKKDDLFDVSVYSGVGVIFYSANAYDLNTNELVRFTNSELSKRNQPFLRWGNPRGKAGIEKTHERIIPLGISIDYNFSDHIKTGVDYRFYFVRTDKLDATSGQRLLNPEEMDSYSDTPNDKFSLLSVHLIYCFGRERKR